MKVTKPEEQKLLESKDVDREEQATTTARPQKGPPSVLLSALFIAFNVISATSIVFANKLVLDKQTGYGWSFVYALTTLHTATSWLGMYFFAAMSMYKKKELNKAQLIPLALAYIGYVVLNNLSLKINTVGFYQLCKIAIAPVVLVMEVVMLGKRVTARVTASVAVVCTGVALATVTDKKIMSSQVGMIIGFLAILITALYQIWAGSYQKRLEASSMQLLDQYCPLAAAMLFGITLFSEPIGFVTPTEDTIFGYPYQWSVVTCIFLSCILGLAVNLSTFLVIGATSSLTYNIVGHIKTVLILAGGYMFFGDSVSQEKLFGVCIAMVGIIWYSVLQLQTIGVKPTTHSLEKGTSKDYSSKS